MVTLITMQDGTEKSLHEHLRDDHHKGTRGYTDTFLGRMHTQLHDHKHEADHTHAAPRVAGPEAAGLIPSQRQPEPERESVLSLPLPQRSSDLAVGASLSRCVCPGRARLSWSWPASQSRWLVSRSSSGNRVNQTKACTPVRTGSWG